MYHEIVKRYRGENLDFSQLQTFNLDEYLGLSPDHPKSFHSYMQQHFFAYVNIPAESIHIPDGNTMEADRESQRYEMAIERAGGIDLLVAGIGANGHIAFNEPGSSFDSRTRAVCLAPETSAAAQLHFDDQPAPGRAITMGIATILQARRILLLASGSAKANATERALHGPVSESVPASALQLHANVTAILDEAAGAGLRPHP
jgi:glucosamine-6-phosphate deaminase